MEDIAQRLGSEFADANFLTISEVDFLLNYFKESGETNQLFGKIHSYTKRYNRFPDLQVSRQVMEMLKQHEFADNRHLDDLQIVLLVNLCPESPEEAKTLIPDLGDIPDQDLRGILDEMARLKNM